MILFDQGGAGEAGATFTRPPRKLESVVDHFWIQRCIPGCQTSWRVVPEANPNIIVTVLSDAQSRRSIRCQVVGPRTGFADVSMNNRVLTCGFRLLPGTLPSVTGLPASEFTDRAVPVEDVFGQKGRSLVDRLNHSRSSSNVLAILSDFLIKQVSGNKSLGRLYALLELGSRVKDIASELGLPLRTLYSRVIHHIGMTPKRLLRIQRLHSTLRIIRNSDLNWAQIASVGGFSDQAHLIREFRDLLGEPPSTWKGRRRLPISSIQVDTRPVSVHL